PPGIGAAQLPAEQRHRGPTEPLHDALDLERRSLRRRREPVRQPAQVPERGLVHWPYDRCMVTPSSTAISLGYLLRTGAIRGVDDGPGGAGSARERCAARRQLNFKRLIYEGDFSCQRAPGFAILTRRSAGSVARWGTTKTPPSTSSSHEPPAVRRRAH